MNSLPTLSADDAGLVHGVRAGQRRPLAKAITLIESTLPAHRVRAQALLQTLMPYTGGALRVGISGVPGVGKSTFIEALGVWLVESGLQVAVLAVDPTSALSGGSILGDKTRMEKLAQRPEAFIRPTPAGSALGGVAEMTRETLLLCEAAGFDVVIVETVGVGQSEVVVAGMTDVFCLLQLPNAGDELQGIKKGIMELADVIVVNKADLNVASAQRAKAQLLTALHMLTPRTPGWQVPVLTLSALSQEGIGTFWATIQRYFAHLQATGLREERRRQQAQAWMWSLIERGLRARFDQNQAVTRLLPELTRAVAAGEIDPAWAAQRLLDL